MEKIVSFIFSNIFIVMIVIGGIVNFFKKVTEAEANKGGARRTQGPSGRPVKKFNIFDFDLEKWIEEQSGQVKKAMESIPTKKESKPVATAQTESRSRRQKDFEAMRPQSSSTFAESKLAANFANAGSSNIVEEENHFDLEIDDLQRAVVMAEILGSPRSKRKSFRY